MNRFATMATKETSFSPLVEGRNKVDLDDVIKKYPKGVTIVGFDLVETTNEAGESETYPIIIIKEDPSIFFFGGSVLNKIVHKWIEAEGDTVENVSNALAGEGGVKVILKKGKTKSNRTVTTVEVIG